LIKSGFETNFQFKTLNNGVQELQDETHQGTELTSLAGINNQCDELHPQCLNCTKGSRDCEYASKSPGPSLPGLQSSTQSPLSKKPSPEIRNVPTGITLLKDAILANQAQFGWTLEHAVDTVSQNYRLGGQKFTLKLLLSHLIRRSAILQHAVLALYFLQMDHATRSTSSPTPPNVANLHDMCYNRVVSHLETTQNDFDINLTTSLILAFHDICIGAEDKWTFHIRNATEQIRNRLKALRTHPFAFRTKFLAQLCIRADVVESNAIKKPANADHEIVQMVYSRMSITNELLVPFRIELDVLLAEISRFQCECAEPLPLNKASDNPPHKVNLRQKYDDMWTRLRRWQGLNSHVSFEQVEAGGFSYGTTLPTEIGLPLLCV
jgi:hypothetical protein